MPLFAPDKAWAGSDVFIIGGGPSLSGFDWSLLKGKNTIGCNAAFRLGEDVCKVCFFSDFKWFEAFEEELAAYKGRVVTHCHRLMGSPHSWLLQMRREPYGLHKHALGFGRNSGCGAVNLALLLGARRVFLLGFDCKLEGTRSHWHDWNIEDARSDVYRRFLSGWEAIHVSLSRVFPGCEIINLNPDSAIPFFPKAHVSTILSHGAHNS